MKRVLTIISVIALCSVTSAWATLYKNTWIPNNSGLYYLIGGGNVEPLPYASDETDINLNVLGVNGLNYNCGVFNPITAILNSLNGTGAEFEQLEEQVFGAAKGAIMELPAYLFSQRFPSAYRLIQDGILNGQHDLSLSTESCYQMQDKIDAGQNPFHDFAQASMGQDWKYNMGLAGSSYSSTSLGAAKGDINQTAQTVAKDNGKNGVEWVRGNKKGDAFYAGGVGQPIILLVSDTVIAGYNVLIGGGRQYAETTSPASTDANHWLVDIFKSPTDAAIWVTNVIGEMKITTFPGGEKSSVPGKGVGLDIAKQVDTIKPILEGLVTGSVTLDAENLKKVSTNQVALNEAVIRQIQKMPTQLGKALVINNLAERIATMRVLAKAKLAQNLLTVGSEVPSIFTLNAAQKVLGMYQTRLQSAITNMRLSANDNESLLANPIATVVSKIAQNENASASIRPSDLNPSLMNNGAVQLKPDQEKNP